MLSTSSFNSSSENWLETSIFKLFATSNDNGEIMSWTVFLFKIIFEIGDLELRYSPNEWWDKSVLSILFNYTDPICYELSSDDSSFLTNLSIMFF